MGKIFLKLITICKLTNFPEITPETRLRISKIFTFKELYYRNNVKMNEKSPDTARDEEDLSWVREYQNGNKDAFNWLVLRHKNRIFNVCFRFLGSYDDANDCAQETFVKMYRALGTFKMEAKLSTWLYRIAVNTCKNKVTSKEYRQRKQSRSLDPVMEDQLGDVSHNPEKSMQRKLQREKIQQCIDKLPDNQRDVVVLRDIDGLAYEEITEVIKQTLGTVKSRLARARQQLRKCLQGVL
jgi:RNA polymerase sigma-70 factor (ECF subfamily)